MGGGEDALGVLVVQGEASVPAGILLQDLHHVSKVQREERVGLLWPVQVHDCREIEREGDE